eukprot:6192950-Pleurochrysis_carterae.AAC.4
MSFGSRWMSFAREGRGRSAELRNRKIDVVRKFGRKGPRTRLGLLNGARTQERARGFGAGLKTMCLTSVETLFGRLINRSTSAARMGGLRTER